MYTYEIKENGYVILKYGRPYIVQEEPFIPRHDLSYEENAKLQIGELEAPSKEEIEKTELEKRVTSLELALAETLGGVK